MKTYKILMADDVPDIRLMFEAMVYDVCSEFVEAGNGEELLAIFEVQSDIDIIFTDIEMPEMNGIDAVEEIRHRFPESKRHIPIIAITSHDSSITTRCRTVGFTDIITKPYTEDLVKKVIRKYC